MTKTPKPILMVAFQFFLLLAATPTQATSLARMSLQQLSAAAQVVVRARCLSNQSRWDHGEIWTFTRFEVLEVFKGSAPGQITVRLIGGQVGRVISMVPAVPRFHPGEETILFLESTRAGDLSVTAWGEGTFRVHRDPSTGAPLVTQAISEPVVFDPATQRFRAAGIRNMPLQVFRTRVAAAARLPGAKQR